MRRTSNTLHQLFTEWTSNKSYPGKKKAISKDNHIILKLKSLNFFPTLVILFIHLLIWFTIHFLVYTVIIKLEWTIHSSWFIQGLWLRNNYFIGLQGKFCRKIFHVNNGDSTMLSHDNGLETFMSIW